MMARFLAPIKREVSRVSSRWASRFLCVGIPVREFRSRVTAINLLTHSTSTPNLLHPHSKCTHAFVPKRDTLNSVDVCVRARAFVSVPHARRRGGRAQERRPERNPPFHVDQIRGRKWRGGGGTWREARKRGLGAKWRMTG